MLYLVATPIGNLGDISHRMTETLAKVDFIAAEDTRVTRRLLAHLGIKKTLLSYFAHNRRKRGEEILTRLQQGQSCALVCDAGTPAISDPGEELVALCIEQGISVVSIPGPCAAIAALVASGLPTGRFCFEGFLSTTKKNRIAHLEQLKEEPRSIVFYEAPHKLLYTLSDILHVWGNRKISIGRELTKYHEEMIYTTLSAAVLRFSKEAEKPRGEFVLVIEGAAEPAESSCSTDALVLAKLRLNELIDEGLSRKDAVRKCTEETGIPKNVLYTESLRDA